MKKLIYVISLILILNVMLFGANPNTDKKTVEQKITGYIDDMTYLSISQFMYDSLNDGKGINLDYTDTSNNVNVYLITPTSTALTQPGLPVGNFSFLGTFAEGQTTARITITHEHLIHSTNPTVKVDYELGVKYSLNNGETVTDVPAKMCLSKDSTITSNISQKSITIDLVSPVGLVSIQNAVIYFRLTKDSPVTESGEYTSTVTFVLEAQ